MANSELLSIAQQFSGLPIDSLIGGPLQAAATANASMAVTQTKFLLDTAFKKNDDGSYAPIMIKMSLTRNVVSTGADGNAVVTPFETKFDLPILTILPLNSLGVDEVDVTFEMEVKSSFSEDTSEAKETEIKASAEWEAKASFGPFSVSIKGTASYDSKDSSTHNTHYEKSNSAKYTVHVHAGQLPLPKGVNVIIEAFAQNIAPVTLPASAPAPVPAQV